ncbi:MAG: hypothetical protein V4550_16025 [Gemmatimonadota bacterium]
MKWDSVVSAVDQPARIVPSTVPRFPMHLRTENAYSGRIVLAMVIDTTGGVVQGSVSVEESTDPRLSTWGCLVVYQMRFTPATVAGKRVVSLTEQPLSYNVGVGPTAKP